MLQWASGNPGFQLTGMGKNTMDYPTLQTQGYIGKGVKLETKGTGSLGLTVGMPIAAGNLFIGSFEVGNALKDAKAATIFGFPFFKHPTKLEGYYKFKPGTEYISGNDKSQSPPKIVIDPSMEGKDKGDIYAILYRADNVNDFLDGNLNFDSEEKIVYIARISDTEMKETDTWTHFSIPFEHRKEIEQSALDEGKYKLAVVFSSSIEGANFKGSIGSTLWIDEVTIHCEEDEQNNE